MAKELPILKSENDRNHRFADCGAAPLSAGKNTEPQVVDENTAPQGIGSNFVPRDIGSNSAAQVTIRAASEGDAPRLLEIYAYYVKNTAITYEYDVPTLKEFEARIEKTLKKYPYLVALIDGEIVGYCYAGAFHERPAYGWLAETTVYLHKNCRGRGVGRKLYETQEKVLTAQGFTKTVALITSPKTEEDKKVYHSIQFHKAMGYKMIGEIENSGYKFSRWFTTAYMEKQLQPPQKNMPPVVSFSKVRGQFSL